MAKKKRKPTKSGGLKDADTGGTKRRRKKRTKTVKKVTVTEECPVEQYVHPDEKRVNNPPVGMVDPNNDPDQPSKSYSYNPRLDPQLQWSGKSENSEFDVDTVSLHEHEKIDPLTIIAKVMKEKKDTQQTLFYYFELPENQLRITEAIEFYKHKQNWSNRLIAGDSLLVMNSLLEKEGMEGQVQTIYIDPPYSIDYSSNFQPYTNKTTVSADKDDDLTQEPEMIRAFRDTWELGVHSYLKNIHNTLLLSAKLLNERGSCFVQISEENLHHVREVMDEVFGPENFVNQIGIKRVSVFAKKLLNNALFYVVWYAKDKEKIKYHQLFEQRTYESLVKSAGSHSGIESPDGKQSRQLTGEERKNISNFMKDNPGWKLFRLLPMSAQGTEKQKGYKFRNQVFYPPSGAQWKTSYEGIKKLEQKNRLVIEGKNLTYKFYFDDFPIITRNSLWDDLGPVQNKIYVVQTADQVIQRCVLMTSDPSDLIFDPTCGSGTTAYVAEKWGRRWITCDTSRIAIVKAKGRLMTTGIFDYYTLRDTKEGIISGFNYKSAPHITVGSLANDNEPGYEVIYDKPDIKKNTIRVSGPFTVEAVPSPTVKSIDALSEGANQDTSQTKASTQQEWRDELLKTGIRGKGGQKIEFSRVESHPATKWLHVDAETKEAKPKRVMVSFGPEHSPLGKRQVAKAIKESQTLVPKPDIIIFAAMQFQDEAAKDIDELKWPGVTILKAEMNKDLQTKDLKKKQSTNESFWLMGSPDVKCKKQKDGKYIVTVDGFDYYNTKTEEIESGDASKIAMWELDTDYDDRSLYPQQIFFPMDGKSGGWGKLAKTLQACIDEDLITKFQGTESIPFEAGPNKKVAVKIIDDRGIESLKTIDLE